MCVLLQISFAAILPNIFKIGQQHTEKSQKFKKGFPFFWNTVYKCYAFAFTFIVVVVAVVVVAYSPTQRLRRSVTYSDHVQ